MLAIVGLAWCWNPRSERRSELAGPDVASAMRAASREILEVRIAVVWCRRSFTLALESQLL